VTIASCYTQVGLVVYVLETDHVDQHEAMGYRTGIVLTCLLSKLFHFVLSAPIRCSPFYIVTL